MHQPGMGKPAVEQPSHAVRSQTASLAAPLQGVPPVSADPLTESPQARPVTRHGVVLVETVQHPRDPPAHPRYRFVHSLAKRLLDLLQFRLQAIPHRLPPDGKVPATVGPARVREPQECEALRFSFSTPLPACPCKPAELDQPRLVRMKLQPELRQPFPEFPEKPLGLGPVLESHHKIVGVADHDQLAFRHFLPPCLLSSSTVSILPFSVANVSAVLPSYFAFTSMFCSLSNSSTIFG